MRLWSLHPRYLDAKGLVALWREALLAQKVLAGETAGYRHHPQLARFRARRDALGAIGAYLAAVQAEAARRGYAFDAGKIRRVSRRAKIPVTRGQLVYELGHLRAKLAVRDRLAYARIAGLRRPAAHPLFEVVPGGVEEWEKI
jgi:Pyrimidine dimer DNA glycosylase